MSMAVRATAGAGRAPPAPPHALVGRDADLDRVLDALDNPLVTLTGPPGVGKTRLALAAAVAAAPRFGDGVAFVDLTTVRDPALVPAELLAELDAGPAGTADAAAQLGRSLAGRELLVVLDNVEHVLDAGPALAATVAAAPRCRFLATSRERLHLHVEREVPVPPLALPHPDDDAGQIARNPAVAMLLQAVRRFQPDFAVTGANRAALVEICIRLDGLPLALELAAARLKLFTPAELTFRLRHRMTVLTSTIRDVPKRHRTLRAALTWSHDLLAPPERVAFRRFAVFVGGATLDAVRAVCGEDGDAGCGDVDDTMASLVDKSLLRRRTRADDRAELVMLESLREYGAELLAEHGEQDAVRARHAYFFARLAADVEAGIGADGEQAWVDALGAEQGNLRAALAHAAATAAADLALPLAAALGWYCYTRGRLGDGRAVMDEAFAVPRGAVDGDALAAALLAAGVLAVGRGDLDAAEELLGRVQDVEQARGGARRIAIGTAFRGHLARARGRHAEAVGHHEHAGALFGELGCVQGVAWSRYDLGLLARHRDDDAAAEHLREGLARFRELGYGWAVGCCTWALADVERRRGHPDEVTALLVEALDSFEAADDGRGLAQCLEVVAAADRSAHRDAGCLLGAAAALRDRLGAPLPDEDRTDHDATVHRVREALGADVADRARCAGRELPRARAVALARAVLARQTAAVPATPLTPREREVAELVATGRTNRQIGRALGISEKTAEVHVHHIIGKLDARSRAEVAAWVGARGSPG